MNPYPRTWIDIDLDALSHNLRVVRERIGLGPRLALVAKADAYGHGLVPISRHAVQSGADWLCVATVSEGVALREAGVGVPILVLSPILEVEAEQAVFYDLRITVERMETALALSAAAEHQGRVARVHLELDTGLNRFGTQSHQLVKLAQEIDVLGGVELEGMCQHFVDSAANAGRTKQQLELFHQMVNEVREGGVAVPILHAANSAGAMFGFSVGLDMVRVGILCYGIDPYGMAEDARPLMTWKARITALREAHAGETVGYSETHHLVKPTRIATLGVGYGDGYHRGLSNQGFVWLSGHRCPVLGLVCMDQTMIDVTAVPEVQLGDVAELLGPNLSVPEIARWAGTNSHEIVTRIMTRVPRRYRTA